MKKIYTFILLFFMYQVAYSQVQLTISDESANAGSTLTVDVTVSDFEDISGLQFSINWNPDIITYSDVINVTSELPQFGNSFGTPDEPAIDPGEFAVTWNTTSTTGLTINEQNHLLFSIVFDVSGDPCDETLVNFSNSPRIIEFLDGTSMPITPILNDGSATVNGAACGGGDVVFDIPEETVMSGGNVCFEVFVDNFTNIGSALLPFQWSPSELSNLSVQNMNSAFPNTPTTLIDESEGTMKFFWQDQTAENPISIDNGMKICDLCFDVVASSGSSACVEMKDITEEPKFEGEILDGDEIVVPYVEDDGCAIVQGGSTDITFYFDDTEIVLGSNTCIPVKTRNFDDIQTFQFDMLFDSNVLTYTGPSDFNNDLPISEGFFALDDEEDAILVSWADISGVGIDIDDEVTLFSICFDVMGDCDQSTEVSFSGSVISGGIEITDINDNFLPFVFEPGDITIICPCNVTSVSGQTNNVSCFGGSDGKITVEADGGNGNYTYTWSNSQSGPMISNLPAGFYTVTVTDGENCNTSETFQITQPAAISISGGVTNETDNCDGEIDIEVSGGNGGFQFAWSDGNIITEDRTGLCKGDYTVTVTDNNDCTEVATFTVDPKPMQVDGVEITNVSCNGGNDGEINIAVSGGCSPYSFNWSPEGPTGLSAGNYSVTITDSSTPALTITQSYPVTEPDPIVITLDNIVPTTGSMANGAINVSVEGGTPNYSYLWTPGNLDTEDISNISSGNYTLVVTDDNGCTQTAEYNVGTDQILIELVSDPENFYNGSDVACEGDCNGIIGGAIIAANGEVSFTLDGEPTSFPITDLCPGTYTVGYSDENGLTGSEDFTIEDANPILAEFTFISECSNGNDGEATVEASGGAGDYLFAWSSTSQTTASVDDLDFGNLTVLITDQNGCQLMLDSTLQECEVMVDDKCYEATSILTPNEDGANDIFIISCLNSTNNTLFVYDRFGKTVFEQANYDNTWTGLSISGAELPENGYMWVLEVITNDGAREIYKGTVTILRSTY